MRAFRVTVREPDEDRATAALWEAGTHGIEVAAAPDGSVALLAYFDEDVAGDALRHRLPFAEVAEARVPDVDWVARFRAGFRTFRVGGFVIAPPWEVAEPTDQRLIVDPGRAFGTGTHETTRLCLLALEDASRRRRPDAVIDVGAGTGLLGLAAARLGARLVVAVDIDPEAVSSVRAHARLNRTRLHVVRGDGGRPLRPGSFDLVLANLTAPLLVEKAQELAALLAPRGRLVLAGLLESDRLEVQAAYADLGTPRSSQEGEWVALIYDEDGAHPRTRRSLSPTWGRKGGGGDDKSEPP
jgi:ribosomal protein L11 methyltransferase